MKTASTVADVVRVSYEVPRVRDYLKSVIHTAAKETFEKYIEGKKFPSPKTGRKILFTSLPPEHQKKIHDHWQESEERGSKEDTEYGEEELLADYNLKVVGGDKKRAAYVAKMVQEGIDKSADICKVKPPVCEGNLGISRDNMPQIMDKSVKALLKSSNPSDKKKGEAAVAAGADPDSDKPIIDIFLSDLKKGGTEIKTTRIPVGKLKATQREIKAGKSFGMADAYYKGDFDPADEEIIVSSDGHILDGHHRWAAMLLADPEREMKVKQVDMPMREFLRRSMKQPGVFRADLQDNIIPKDAPLDLNEGGKANAKGKKEEKKDTDKKEKKAGSTRYDATPMTDMEAYTESLYKSFMLPYPAIDDSLGVERQDVHGTWELHGGKGFIRFKSQKAGADIKVIILPDGTHVVGGMARGVKLPAAKFKFHPSFIGLHRGTQGDISHYIEDQLPAKVVYTVLGQTYDSLEDLLRRYKQDGVETSMSVRKELRGQPRLKGLAGPMFDGRKGDIVKVRYETWEHMNSMD
jgi:hypothetical protein